MPASNGKWFVSKSAIKNAKVKTPLGSQFAGYFFQGASVVFGHFPSKKGGGKK